MKILLTIVLITAFIAVCIMEYIQIGLPAIIPCLLVALLFGTCLLFLWEKESFKY